MTIAAELRTRGDARGLEGPLLFLDRTVDAGLGDAVEVLDGTGRSRPGRVAAVDDERLVIEVLAPTIELNLRDTTVRFLGAPLCFEVGPGLLGRVFDGVGQPVDGGPPVPAVRSSPIVGRAMNPRARAVPDDFIETGVSAIDLLNSLVRGQKLPIFSAGGLPHERLVLDIVRGAGLLGAAASDFAVVFAAIGIPHAVAERFQRVLAHGGALARTVLFLNLASDPATQRLLTPRFALTAAEYLAFEEGKEVLVILDDMTNYCEALREVSASHGDMPGRKGYPGFMYSDLATIYERAGRLRDRPGSITQVPVLTMPGNDITHPIPDLTGYITEGQVVLSRDLDRKGVFPPIDVPPSLSRLMDEGTGEGYTHRDHPALAAQLYAAYARGMQARTLARVIGAEGLSAIDRRYLAFADAFESRFVNQRRRRSLDRSMAIGWSLLAALPDAELGRLSDEQITAQVAPLRRLAAEKRNGG